MDTVWQDPLVLTLMLVCPMLLSAFASGRPTFRKPPPEGVVQVVGKLGRGWSLVELKDGSLMAVADGYRISNDDGVTWSDVKPFPDPISARSSDGSDWRLGIIRLKSGSLAVYNARQMWLSHDEGKTWGDERSVKLLGSPYYATMVQLSRGRLLYPNRICFAGEHEETPGGHTKKPEADIGSVSYSDDEGRTWQLCNGELMGWFDDEGEVNGKGGVTPFDEPSLAETNDGRVLYFARSTVGRIVYTYSNDGGVNWCAVRPTELAASYSPCRLVRIPQTGDLLCVWNQVSRAEIRRGFRRSRLSAAISRDSGRSWENFKTLELSGGMEDIDRIPPEFPIRHVASMWSDVEFLPDFGIFRYMNVCFAKDKVYVMYVRQWLEGEADPLVFEDAKKPRKKCAEQVLRIYPLDYFYK